MPEDTQTPPPLTPAPAHAFSRTTIIIAAGIFAFFVILVASGILYFENSSQNPSADYLTFDAAEPHFLSDVDAPTFASLGGGYYKDKNSVYFWEGEVGGMNKIEEADIKTFLYDSNNYVGKDAQHVFFKGKLVNGADPQTLEAIAGYNGNCVSIPVYFKDKNSIYVQSCEGAYAPLSLVSGADVSSFQIVLGQDSYDAQDKNHKYLNGQVLGTTAAQTSKIPEGADAASFQTVNDQAGKFNQLFGKDKNNVYEWSDAGIWGVLPNADPATFSFDSSTDIAEDSLHVWANIDRLVPNADSATFSKINRFWYKDRNHVFSSAYDPGGHLDIIASANPLTFTPLLLKGEATVYGTNTTHDKIFCGGESDVMDADAASFEILSIFSSKDKNHTYDGCSIYDPKNP